MYVRLRLHAAPTELEKILLCFTQGLRPGLLTWRPSGAGLSCIAADYRTSRDSSPTLSLRVRIVLLRRARDSNSHTLAGGGFQDRCNTIMRALRVFSSVSNDARKRHVPLSLFKLVTRVGRAYPQFPARRLKPVVDILELRP